MSPDKPSNDSQALLSGLKPESAAWQALLDLLQEEEQALIAGEADRLALLNTAKLTQLQTVSDHARNRHANLQAAGLTPDHAGMEAWLAQHGQSGHHAIWQKLREMEQEAKAANQRIGTLIELRLNSTRQALNVLVHSSGNQNGLYDQEGLAVVARKGKPLTAA